MKKKPAAKRPPLTAAAVRRELRKHIDPEKAAFYPRFFKTGPGQYGEGDKFLGVVVPKQRLVARQFSDLPETQIDRLLDDPFHECRLTGLFILVKQFEREATETERRDLLNYYLDRTDAVNNWDLVDGSASQIVGGFLADKSDRKLLKKLARSKSLWEQRIAVIATLPLIKQQEYDEILGLAEKFLTHPHDLIHKSVGWMLREVGKQDRAVLLAFLDQYAASMPRTMLRYSIEKLPESRRKQYLNA